MKRVGFKSCFPFFFFYKYELLQETRPEKDPDCLHNGKSLALDQLDQFYQKHIILFVSTQYKQPQSNQCCHFKVLFGYFHFPKISSLRK